MPLQVPQIDSRSYQQLLDEALARIRVHTPEWTNYNDSDPGITLLQLFAFLSENVLYRSSLIPERARIKFLTLLDIPLEPAHAAVGVVTLEHQSGPLTRIAVAADTELHAGQVPFRTRRAVSVAPVEGRAYVKAPLTLEREAEVRARYAQVYEGFEADDVDLVLYETRPVGWAASGGVDLSAGTVDQALWIALMARTPETVETVRRELAGAVLTVGIVPETSADGRVLAPGGARTALARELRFELPHAEEPLPQDAAQRIARYRLVPTSATGDVLAKPGLVEVTLPGVEQLGLWQDLEPDEDGTGDFPPAVEGDDAERIVTWLRIRPAAAAGSTGQASVRLLWAGVNATLVQHRARVPHELLGTGTGAPDQTYRLVNMPVLVDSLTVTVDGEPWERVDDLLAAAPEVPVTEPFAVGYGERATPPAKAFVADRESGEVRFGSGLHGARPPAGALIEASYDYGGGLAGVVGAEAITKGPLLPAGLKVSNPFGTWGGDEPTSVEEAERQIARVVRHRDRLVTAEDARDIALVTPGVDMGRVEVIPLLHPQLPDVRLPGVLTVLLIPRHDPAHPDAPEPDGLFLDLVCAHLEPRRLLTTELHVRGPQYVDVWVSIGVDVEPGREIAPVLEAVKQRIRTFLSSLQGGRAGSGWPLSTGVERLELWAQAANVNGVAKVFDALLTDASGAARDRVPLTGLQLPRLVAIGVTQGDPRPLDEIRGDPGEPPPDVRVLPVPVDPVEC